MTSCVVCEWAKVYKAQRCAACYWYRRRHGSERPEELIVRHGQRVLAARARGG